MGACLSTTKISGSNSSTPSAVDHRRTTGKQDESGSNVNSHKPKEIQQKHGNDKKKEKTSSRKGVVACGKRTDFGYFKDFDTKYSIGKLLGHGQFGYTYVAIDKDSGDRVAVKKIDKNKVFTFLSFLFKNCFYVFMLIDPV